MLNQGWRARLTELARIEAGEPPFISVYLDLRTDGDAKRQSLTFLHDAIHDHTKREPYHGVARRGFDDDLAWIGGYIGDQRGGRYDPASQGIVFLACGAREIREVIELPVAVANRFEAGDAPLLAPLAAAVDADADYVAALIDVDSCRVFAVSLGRVTASAEVQGDTEDLSRETREVGWSEGRLQKHVQGWRTKFAKEGAALMERFSAKHDAPHLVLAGADAERAELKRHLPEGLLARIVAEEHLQIDLASEAQVLDATLPLARAAAQRASLADAAQVLTAASEGRPAAMGPEATLRALEEGAVRHLVLATKLDGLAWRCERCGHGEAASLPPACTACDGPVREQPLVELLLREALRQDAEITFAPDAGELNAYGGVGALLRFAAAKAR